MIGRLLFGDVDDRHAHASVGMAPGLSPEGCHCWLAQQCDLTFDDQR